MDFLSRKTEKIRAHVRRLLARLLIDESSSPFVFTLVAHSDTVPVGDPSRWTHLPFCGHVDEARQVLYGRGACDNKGGIAVALYTLKRLQTSLPRDFRGKIALDVVVDEESGANSPVGLRHLLDLGTVRPFPTTSSSPTSCCCGRIYCYQGRTVTIGHREFHRRAASPCSCSTRKNK